MLFMQRILNGEDLDGRTPEEFEWELIEESADVENEPEEA
jgi:hypothetical protein